MEQLLVHLVVVFVAKDHNHDLRVSEHAGRRSHHVGEELGFDFIVILFVLQLDEVGLLNVDLQHTTRLSERVVDIICSLEVIALPSTFLSWTLIDHYPLFFAKVVGFLDG